MEAESHGLDLVHIVALLAAAVVGVPIFRRFGLGAVLGYPAAGVGIGPFGLRLIVEPAEILHVAELGVDAAVASLRLARRHLRARPAASHGLRARSHGGRCRHGISVSGAGFVLTSTAIVMQLLEERRQLSSPRPAGSFHPIARGPRDRAAARSRGVSCAHGAKALETLGAAPEEIEGYTAAIRERDDRRFEHELVAGEWSGKAFFFGTGSRVLLRGDLLPDDGGPVTEGVAPDR